MLTVFVDRDSVAMGDDVESHVERWEFHDDVRIGEVLVRMAQGYLVNVAGPVAWTVHLGDEPHVVQHDGYLSITPSGQKQLAVVLADGAAVSVSQSHRRWNGRSLLRETSTPNSDGQYFVFARYLSAGGPVPLERYREWIAKTDEQIRADDAAFRARAYPGLYDENGERRRG